MNVYFKKFIIFFLVLGILIVPLRPQRASAFAVVDDVIVIGGVCVATYVLVELMIKAGETLGYEPVAQHGDDLKTYLTKKIMAFSTLELLKYFCTAKDSAGQDYVELTDDGYENTNNVLITINSEGVGKIPVSTDLTTDNVSVKGYEPFMHDGYYMKTYSVVTSVGHVYDSFNVTYGDSFSVQLYEGYNYRVYSFTPSSNAYIRIIQSEENVTLCQYSYNNSNWYILGSNGAGVLTYKDTCVSFGYKTVSNTVYLPGSDVVENTGNVEALTDGQVVAVPISGQYENSKGEKVYGGIEGSSASVVSGLLAKDLTTSTTQTGTATDTASKTLTQEAVKDAVRDGVDSSDIGNTSIPNTASPTLDFSPLYIDLSTKFPFCVPFDFINLIKQFQSTAQTPSFHVDFDSAYFRGGGSFDFDFSRFDLIVKVVRYFILLGFVIYLVRKTRAWIGNGGAS